MKAALFVLALASTMGATAQAHPLDALIQRDATVESRFASDLAHGKIDVTNATLLTRQEADLHKLEAHLIPGVATLDSHAIARLREAENDMAGAVQRAEKHAKDAGAPMDRMHLRVATMREAEQEGLIARELKQDRLTPSDASALEAAQARIALAQSDADERGRESMKAARSIQDMQNVQDYAIRADPALS
ncbi:MAG TPA: hypothetical protein VMG60_24065 [Burkholderiaceae bacterium]|nr:hypothetical protein [Burkholderiaceae bacterium]